MMLKRMGRLSLGMLMLIFVMGSAMAQDEQVFTADISLDYNTKYVWRGIEVNGESVFQPGVSGSAYGFTGSIWANIDMTNYWATAGEFSEIDYSLDYSGSVPGMEKFGYSVGVIQYIFPTLSGDGLSTTEIYAGASLDVLLSPFFSWYRDVNNADGSYLQFGISHSFEKELAPDYSVGLDLSASFGFADSGYNSWYYGINETKWNDFTVGIGVPFNLKYVTLTPSLNISTMLDDEIAAAHQDIYSTETDTADRTNVWFGVSLSKSF